MISRAGEKIQLHNGSLTASKLAEIKVIEGHSCLCPMLGVEMPYDKLWLVVKYMKTEGRVKGYRLSEGDVLKVGRMKFRVKELNASLEKCEKPFNLDEMINLEDDSENSEDESLTESAYLCRVCLGQNFDETNPLISPCLCGGTMKYIHLECLQKYLKSKITTRASETSLSFGWKRLECDLCKKPFPYKVSVKNKVVELVQIPKPPGKYVILEALCSDRTSSKGIHLVSLHNKDCIRFGRSNECELKFSDISVSRLHAVIKFQDGHFYVEDTNSKFGTLVQIKRPIALESYPSISVQAGKTLMTVKYRKHWSLFTACFRSAPSLFEYRSGSSLFPIATGIPLSVSDGVQLSAFAGVRPISKQKYNQNKNLLFEHNQLGVNSSFENEEEMLDLEEVEVAILFDNN